MKNCLYMIIYKGSLWSWIVNILILKLEKYNNCNTVNKNSRIMH